MSLVILIHLFFTFSLTGLIWLIQRVQYPGFAEVGPNHFIDYHRRHSTRITPLVAVLMGGELGTAVWLAVWDRAFWIPLILCVAIWVCTLLVQIPQHRQLSRGYDEGVIRRLVRGNWARTWLWTLRSAILIGMLRY